MKAWLQERWWVMVVILAIACVIGWEEKRCQAETYQCRAEYSAYLAGVPPNQKASEQEAITAACEPNGYLCRLFGPANLPTMLLVFLGIVGISAARHTLRAIKQQGDIMVSSERAWVMVEVEQVPGAGPIWDTEVIEQEIRTVFAGQTGVSARITCKNDGKVPAWITEKRAGLDIVGTLPQIPDWGRTQPIQVEPEPLSVGEIGKPRDETLICKRPREAGKMVILYGIVKYRDPFGDNRSTTFGYKVRDDGAFERLPYPKYNENT